MAILTVTDQPDRIDVVILAGRPFSMLVPLLIGTDEVEAGDVASVRAQVRDAIGSEQVVHLFTTDDASAEIVGTGSDPASVRLRATSDETTEWQALWPGSAPQTVVWWDLEVTDTGGERHQASSPGTITLVHQVTR